MFLASTHTLHVFCDDCCASQADGELITGALGPETGGLTVEQGYEAGRHCGLNIVATLKKQLGDLDRVEQVIKVRACLSLPLISFQFLLDTSFVSPCG